jgi:hypothetical protein
MSNLDSALTIIGFAVPGFAVCAAEHAMRCKRR